MDLTPKQQTSEAIRQAETILVTTGQHPSVDQVSAVIALSAILRKFGKKVSAVISDTLPQSVQLLDAAAVERNLGGLRDFVLKVDVTKAEVDKLRYEVADGKLQIFVTPFKGGFAPSDVTYDYGEANFDYDMAIVLGVPTRARIDRVYEQNQALFAKIPVVNLDFHRSNENYGAVNLIESNASSLCEMLVALSESLQGGIIDADIATALLMGIVGSTDRFTASHTTSKSLTVAAQMMAAGARQQAVVKALYRESGRGDQPRERADQPRGERAAGSERSDQTRGGDQTRGERAERNAERGSERGAGERAAGGERAGERTHGQRDNAPRGDGAARSEGARDHTREGAQRDGVPREGERSDGISREARTGALPSHIAQPAAPERRTGPVVDAPEAAHERGGVQDARPFRGNEAAELPIIDPGHIEFSEPSEAAAAAAENDAQEAREPQASRDAKMPPTPSPMADFAAAAEVLVQRQPNDAIRPERPE